MRPSSESGGDSRRSNSPFGAKMAERLVDVRKVIGGDVLDERALNFIIADASIRASARAL